MGKGDDPNCGLAMAFEAPVSSPVVDDPAAWRWDDDELEPEPPKVLYRMHARGHGQQILADGFQPEWGYGPGDHRQPFGVYFFAGDPRSEHAANHRWDPRLGDLYEIDAAGLDLHPDYELDVPAWYCPEAISPDRIRRIG